MTSCKFFSEEFVLRSQLASPLMKPFLTPGWVARRIACALKGVNRLEVSLDVEDSFVLESFTFVHCRV